ncbi:MAG: hypothetical protein WA151_13955 [Desulfatirhabdiaceae bacterium]
MSEPTKSYKRDLLKAMRAAEAGDAYHWPTVARILADEVKRLSSYGLNGSSNNNTVTTITGCSPHAQRIVGLPDGDGTIPSPLKTV